jgi:rhomboid family GlyGly-CTERM serine protease
VIDSHEQNVTAVVERRRNGWPVLAVIGLAALAAAFGGDELRLLGRYDRTALAGGEYWRLLTGHLLHLGWGHLWPNLAALTLIGALFDDVLDRFAWVAITLGAVLAIDGGLYVLAPQVDWYVGLSGVLHGLVAGGALTLVFGKQPLGGWLLAGLGAKLAFEQIAGPLPFTAAATGGPVIIAAHLYGSVGGLLASSALCFMRRRGSRL